jgi:hypothetical protein
MQEQIARQLFGDLAVSLVHWLTASARRCLAWQDTVLLHWDVFASKNLDLRHACHVNCREAAEPMAFLDSVIDGLVRSKTVLYPLTRPQHASIQPCTRLGNVSNVLCWLAGERD